jgi:DNA-binding NarL/FixJ family response regulator
MQRFSHPDPLAEVGNLASSELTPDVGLTRPDVRALVVGPDPLVREGFVARLGSDACGEADSGEDLIVAVATTEANVVLWDLGPNELDDDASFERIEVPVVALSAPGVRASDVLARGASAVLLRNASAGQLRSTVDTVLQGLTVVEPALLATELASEESDASPDLSNMEPLTPRESEVLELMALGLSNKEIAARLDISTHTAKFHIGAILAKLDSSTRTEAVVRAVQRGLVLV